MPAHPALLRRSIVAALPATSLALALVLGSPASASPAASASDLGSGAVGSVTAAQLADVPAGIGLKTRTSVLARSAAAAKVRAAKVRAAKVRAAKVRDARARSLAV